MARPSVGTGLRSSGRAMAWRLACRLGPWAVLAVAACASPTLPLPPPEAPMQSVGTDADHVHLSSPCGGAEGDALIVIINQNLPPDQSVGGSIASDCGAWDANVLAHSGDVLSITQEAGTVSSTETRYVVR